MADVREAGTPWALRAPRLNANDEVVTLTRWLLPNESQVRSGQPVAEIETEKATTELIAEADGPLRQMVDVGVKVEIGSIIAYIGGDPDKVPRPFSAKTERQGSLSGTFAATAKARALAASENVDLAEVAAITSGATIKETDVSRFIAGRASSLDAKARSAQSVDKGIFLNAGKLTAQQARVARNLREAWARGIYTSLAFTLDLTAPRKIIAAEIATGRHVSLLSLFVRALSQTLPKYPLLMSTIEGEELWQYRSADIAIVVRSLDGRLFTPVVRGAGEKSLIDVAKDCVRLTKTVMRGKLNASDVGGACLTLSIIPNKNVESFVALPAPSQAAVVAISAERDLIEMGDGQISTRPVATATLTYDHALCDGIYVADFFEALNKALSHAAT